MNDVVLLRVLTLPLHVNWLPHLQKNPQRNSRNKLHQLKAVYLKLMDAYTYIFKSVVTHELNPLHQSQSKSNCKINCSVPYAVVLYQYTAHNTFIACRIYTARLLYRYRFSVEETVCLHFLLHPTYFHIFFHINFILMRVVHFYVVWC